jgi:CHAT domain-containing protein
LAGQRAKQDSALWESLDTAEAVRSLGLRELLETAFQRSANSATDASRWRDALTTQQTLLERRLSRVVASDSSVAELQRDIAETRARIAALTAQNDSSKIASIRSAEASPSARQLQRSIPADYAIAYFFVGAARSDMWLLTATSIDHRTFAGRDALAQAVRTSLPTDDTQRLGEFAPMLREIGATLGSLAVSHLTIVPDGPLNSLPFAALPTTTRNGAPSLIEQKVVELSTTLRTLQESKASKAKAADGIVAIVSDPVYSRDDVRLATTKHILDGSHLRGEPTTDFVRLPYSGAEARAVAREFQDRKRIELTGLAANSQAFSRLPFGELDVLHVATHARAREDDPAVSALYLSAFDADGQVVRNSAITARIVLDSGMRAHLVVLSGCSTAGNASLAGEGLLGLTHSFLANGSGAVIASLWSIEDSQTSRLMADFYAAFRAGHSAPEALALAQRAAIKRDPRSQTWASFAIRGNGFGSEVNVEEMR